MLTQALFDLLVHRVQECLSCPKGPLLHAELERAFAVNVKGTALAMKHAAQAMRKNGGTNTEPGGAIVNISSISSLIAQPGFLP